MGVRENEEYMKEIATAAIILAEPHIQIGTNNFF